MDVNQVGKLLLNYDQYFRNKDLQKLEDNFNEFFDAVVYLNLKYEEGNPILTDDSYDRLYFILQSMYSYLKKPNDLVFDLKQKEIILFDKFLLKDNYKEKIPVVLPSLKKITTWEKFLKWYKKHPNEDIIITPKLDGVSILLDIKNKCMYSKGDGISGFKFNEYNSRIFDSNFNFIYNDSVLNLSSSDYHNDQNLSEQLGSIDLIDDDLDDIDNLDDLVENFDMNNFVQFESRKSEDVNIDLSKINLVRGELIIREDHFLNFNKNNEYSTSRNLIAGMVNTKTFNELKNQSIDITDFIPYEIIYPDYTFKDQLDLLKEYSFKVPKYFYLKENEVTYDNFKSVYQYFLNNSHYKIDGIVIRLNKQYSYDSESLIPPEYQIAFKFNSEYFETTIKDIVWTIGSNETFTPTLIIEPIEYNNKIFTKVYGYNYKYLKNNGMEIGQNINVRFSGEIPKAFSLPNAVKLENDNNLNLPEDSEIIDLTLRSLNRNQLISKYILNVLKYFKITGISIKTLDKLLESMDFTLFNNLENVDNIKYIIHFLNNVDNSKINILKNKIVSHQDLLIAFNKNQTKNIQLLFKTNPDYIPNKKNIPAIGKNGSVTRESINNLINKYVDNLDLIKTYFKELI